MQEFGSMIDEIARQLRGGLSVRIFGGLDGDRDRLLMAVLARLEADGFTLLQLFPPDGRSYENWGAEELDSLISDLIQDEENEILVIESLDKWDLDFEAWARLFVYSRRDWGPPILVTSQHSWDDLDNHQPRPEDIIWRDEPSWANKFSARCQLFSLHTLRIEEHEELKALAFNAGVVEVVVVHQYDANSGQLTTVELKPSPLTPEEPPKTRPQPSTVSPEGSMDLEVIVVYMANFGFLSAIVAAIAAMAGLDGRLAVGVGFLFFSLIWIAVFILVYFREKKE